LKRAVELIHSFVADTDFRSRAGDLVKPLPKTDHSLLLRTDFSDDAAWASLCEAIRRPSEDGFTASIDGVSDVDYDGLTIAQLIVLSPQGSDRRFAFIADRSTFADRERPILVVDLHDEPGRMFRVIPREMWGVENNLAIANMDFREFAESVDPDGVFRGFPQP
jgi:hypothetical protein